MWHIFPLDNETPIEIGGLTKRDFLGLNSFHFRLWRKTNVRRSLPHTRRQTRLGIALALDHTLDLLASGLPRESAQRIVSHRASRDYLMS